MISNIKLSPIVTDLLIRRRKLNISLAFITQSYFQVPKIFRLYSIRYLIMKISNKQQLQKIALNYSSDIGFEDFMFFLQKMYWKIVFFICY